MTTARKLLFLLGWWSSQTTNLRTATTVVLVVRFGEAVRLADFFFDRSRRSVVAEGVVARNGGRRAEEGAGGGEGRGAAKRESSGHGFLRPSRRLENPPKVNKKKKKKRDRVPTQTWVREDEREPATSTPSAPPSSSQPTIDPCSLVRCPYPECPDGAEPFLPEEKGACCLRCPDAFLNAGDKLDSGAIKRVEGAYLHVRPDGNVVLYAGGGPPSSPGRKLWETGYVTSKPGDKYFLQLQGDGHLLSYDENDELIWKNNRPGGVTGDYHLALIRDDGDNRIGASGGSPIGMAVRRGTELSPGETLWDTLEQCEPRSSEYESLHSIGSVTALIPDANDFSRTFAGIEPEDGESGDVDFPHGRLRPLATVGEVDKCTGHFIVGRPDGNGAYLVDRYTVRVIVQNESQNEKTRPYRVNDGTALITGSHVQYVDYDREMMSNFMGYDNDEAPAASSMYKGSGEMIEKFYNVKGELLGPRNLDGGPTVVGAHYGNTDPDGNWALVSGETPEDGHADWLLRKLCSAHLEPRHQWGEGFGLADDLYLTNEENGNFPDEVDSIVGLGVHAIHVATKTLYSLGVFGFGGFEKTVEFRSGHDEYVTFSPSGYNGAMGSELDAIIARRNSIAFPKRSDENDWIMPKNIVPARIYLGKKGYMEDGTPATDENDILARNGLRYGKLYGFAIDLSDASSGAKGMYRDDWHKAGPPNGSRVPGKWIAIRWSWDGIVRDLSHDGSVWEWQDDPPGYEGRSTWKYWTGKGPDASGKKTEHNTPDPREGKFGFVTGSTEGYFGHYYVTDLDRVLADLPREGRDFPSEIDGEYYVYQSDRDVSSQIRLGGKGLYAADGKDATRNYSGDDEDGYGTFRQIDGLETILGKGDALHLIVQEDSSNRYGERMFLTSELEHEDDGNELTYHLVAFSGGPDNTRSRPAGVGIPAGVYSGDQTHEFSGATDLSGLLAKGAVSGEYLLSPDDIGHMRRKADADVSINDKTIVVSLQAENYQGGVIEKYDLDVGGQWLLYRPNIPGGGD